MPVMSENELNRRRQEILVGARKCFAEYGYEGATVRRLEQATGKSRDKPKSLPGKDSWKLCAISCGTQKNMTGWLRV